MWKRDQSASTTAGQRPQSPEPPPPPALPPPRSEPSPTLVMNLGDSVVIKGELSGSEDLTLCGQMDGSVKLPDHTLTIGPSAEIRAEISAKAVIITGAVVGNISATDVVEIQGTGSVIGDIVAPRLTIVDGARFRGRVDMPGAGGPEQRKKPEARKS